MSRILLVDGDVCFRQCLGLSLGLETGFGANVQAGSLAEARACLEAGRYEIDAAIIEVVLPDGDGADLIGEIGALRRDTRRIPVMVLTATENSEVHDRLLRLGAAEVSSKAATLEDILAAARRLGRGRRILNRNGSVSRMVDGVLSRQARARVRRNGETFDDALEAVLRTEAGKQLEELRVGRCGDEWAHRWQEGLAPKRASARKRARREAVERASRDAAWERFVQTETREMRLRKDGQLAGVLGGMRGANLEALPTALRRLASEDQRQAEAGLVALMRGGKISYKRLDALIQEDGPARVAANRARTTWLKERRDGWISTREEVPTG